MALAVTHVLGAIVILDLFRHYLFGIKKFPRYLVVVGGIAGLAPDLDIPLTWIYNLLTGSSTSFHGLFTHSLAFPILFLVIAVVFRLQRNHKWEKIFYVIAAGWFIHLILDCIFHGNSTYFWPIGINTVGFCPHIELLSTQAASIDAIILVVWLVHEEIHKKIRDYI